MKKIWIFVNSIFWNKIQFLEIFTACFSNTKNFYQELDTEHFYKKNALLKSFCEVGIRRNWSSESNDFPEVHICTAVLFLYKPIIFYLYYYSSPQPLLTLVLPWFIHVTHSSYQSDFSKVQLRLCNFLA